MFVRNVWYVAAWDHELGRDLLRRVILCEPVVLYRRADGGPVALEDRIFRLGTGSAWSQVPPSRTVRFVSNVEAFRTEERTVLMVRSNFLLSEFRAGESRVLSGWCGHRLRRRQVGWEIEAKQINLLERDQALRNPSALF